MNSVVCLAEISFSPALVYPPPRHLSILRRELSSLGSLEDPWHRTYISRFESRARSLQDLRVETEEEG